MAKLETDWSVAIADELGWFGALAMDSWMLMLLLGVLHTNGVHIPALGYWVCMFTAWVISAISQTGAFSIHQRIRKLTPNYGKKAVVSTADALVDLLKRAGAK